MDALMMQAQKAFFRNRSPAADASGGVLKDFSSKDFLKLLSHHSHQHSKVSKEKAGNLCVCVCKQCVWNQPSNFRYVHLVLLIGATDSSEHPHVDMRHILTKNHPQRGATLAQMLGTGQ